MKQFDFPDASVFLVGETTYVVADKKTGKLLVVDPTKKNNPRALEIVAEISGRLDQQFDVFVTHPHQDHFDGAMALKTAGVCLDIICHGKLAELKEELAALTYYETCDKYPSTIYLYGQIILKWRQAFGELAITRTVGDGQVDGYPLRVVSYCCHSPCDSVLVGDGFSLSGDMLFVEENEGRFELNFGRTDLPGSDEDAFDHESSELLMLILAEFERIRGQNRELVVFPGHGQPFNFQQLKEAVENQPEDEDEEGNE